MAQKLSNLVYTFLKLSNRLSKKSSYPNHYIMKKNRKIVFEQNGFKCEECGEIAKQIHHRNFDRGDHRIENLEAVCFICHYKLHNSAKVLPRKSQ